MFSYFKSSNKKNYLIRKIIKESPSCVQDLLLTKYFKLGSEYPQLTDSVIDDVSVIYRVLRSSCLNTTFIYINPFTNKHIKINVLVEESTSDLKRYSCMSISNKNLFNRTYFDLFEIFICRNDFININTCLDPFNLFKYIFYHELAHASCIDYFNDNKHYSEISADLSSIIYCIKKDNLSLTDSKNLIARLLNFRISTINISTYLGKYKSAVRTHSTELYLIVFRLLNEVMLKKIKSLENTDILRFVSFLIQSMNHLVKNAYSIDFDNKELIKFLFYNNYNPDIIKTNSSTRAYIRATHVKKEKDKLALYNNRHNQPLLSLSEHYQIKDCCLDNILSDLTIFNDFMTFNLLNSHFDYCVQELFKPYEAHLVFTESFDKFNQFKIKRSQVKSDIPFNFSIHDLKRFLKQL